MRTAGKGLSLAVVLNFIFANAVADPIDNLAKELVALRAEVDRLHSDLEEKKTRYKQDMAALSMQKADLETNIKREELNLKQLQQTLEKNQAIGRAVGLDSEHLKPLVLEAIEHLQAHISKSLPFKVQERLAALEELRIQVQTDVITSHKAVNRLWGFCEDELRMTRENGIFQQTIELGGEQKLVEVARLGSVMMFFRTKDEQVGKVVREGGQWRYVTLQDEDSVRVEQLFDALKKQIRTGYFELPYALSIEGKVL